MGGFFAGVLAAAGMVTTGVAATAAIRSADALPVVAMAAGPAAAGKCMVRVHRLGGMGFTNLHGIDRDTTAFATDRATVSAANLDTDDLGLDGRKFDLITAIELIEHLENPGRLFHHVARHLADGGLFLVTTPNIHSALCRLRFFLTGELKQFDAKGDPTHIYPVLLTALDRVLPRHGLQLTAQWPYPEGGSITSRLSTRLLAKVARLFVPDPHPGDILCLAIRKGPVV